MDSRNKWILGGWDYGRRICYLLVVDEIGDFMFTGLLNACADHVAEDLGEQVHGYMTQIGFDPLSFAASALFLMYSKCETIQKAKRAFKGMP